MSTTFNPSSSSNCLKNSCFLCVLSIYFTPIPRITTKPARDVPESHFARSVRRPDFKKTIHNFLQDILHQHLTVGHWVSRTELHIVAGNTLGIGNPQFHGDRVIYNSSPTLRCLERLRNPIRNVICAAMFPKRKKHLL